MVGGASPRPPARVGTCRLQARCPPERHRDRRDVTPRIRRRHTRHRAAQGTARCALGVVHAVVSRSLTRTLTLSLTLSRTLTLILSLALRLSLSWTLSQTLSLTLSPT